MQSFSREDNRRGAALEGRREQVVRSPECRKKDLGGLDASPWYPMNGAFVHERIGVPPVSASFLESLRQILKRWCAPGALLSRPENSVAFQKSAAHAHLERP